MIGQRLIKVAMAVLVITALTGCQVAGPRPSPTVAVTPTGSAVPSDPVSPTPTTVASSVARLPAPIHVRVKLDHPVLQAPYSDSIATAGGAIWIERYLPDPQLLRFDLEAETVTHTIALDYPVLLLPADDGSLWAVGPYGGAPGPDSFIVSRINLATGRLRAVAEVPVSSVAVGLGSIWAASWPAGLERFDPVTGMRLETLDVAADGTQVACGAVWAWTYERGLDRIDPETRDVDHFAGTGPLIEDDRGCWWVDDDEVGLAWPLPSTTRQIDAWTASNLHVEGSTFWKRPEGTMQRWDPATRAGIGPTWVIDTHDQSHYPKIGDDGHVLSAGGRVWLVNGFEVVGFDIPAR